MYKERLLPNIAMPLSSPSLFSVKASIWVVFGSPVEGGDLFEKHVSPPLVGASSSGMLVLEGR